MRSQAIDKWQTRREAGTQSHGALVASRAADAPCSWGKERPPDIREVPIVRRLFGASAEALIIVILITGLLAIPVLGARGGGGGKPAGGDSNSSLSLVMVDPADTVANHGDQVTFSVATTATDKPWVRLDCYQSGTWVSTSNAGFFEAYPWAPNFSLESGGWTSGAGDCIATLYLVTSNGRSHNLASLNFHVTE